MIAPFLFYIYSMQKAIFSVITGGYDTLLKAPNYKGWDAIMFTDQDFEDSKGWQIRKIKPSGNALIDSRYIKICSHVHLPEYDLICYVDGNQVILNEPPSVPMWFMHPTRKSIFDEAAQIIKNRRFAAHLINEQIDYYKEQGYKEQGLYLNGFFIRQHEPNMNYLHDVWFQETCRFVPRDQLTLPFAMFLTGLIPENISLPNIKGRLAVVKEPHQQKYESSPHYQRVC